MSRKLAKLYRKTKARLQAVEKERAEVAANLEHVSRQYMSERLAHNDTLGTLRHYQKFLDVSVERLGPPHEVVRACVQIDPRITGLANAVYLNDYIVGLVLNVLNRQRL